MEEVLLQLESLEKKTKKAGDASSGLMADLLPVGSSRVGEVEAHFPALRDDATHPLPLSVRAPSFSTPAPAFHSMAFSKSLCDL
jgi:hypothetical protein